MNSRKASKANTRIALILLGVLALAAPRARAMSGTSQIASSGKPVPAVTGWPEGVLGLVNDPLRADGWNPWFSQMANDVNFYTFKVRDADDVNRLIQKLIAIKAPKIQVQLNPGREATYLGYSTVLEKGNGTAIVFSVGNQQVLNAWYQRLPEVEPGVRECWNRKLTQSPTAEPPTLILYAGNAAIDLKKLNIPQAVEVSTNKLAAKGDDPPERAVVKAIEDFVVQHKTKPAEPAAKRSETDSR